MVLGGLNDYLGMSRRNGYRETVGNTASVSEVWDVPGEDRQIAHRTVCRVHMDTLVYIDRRIGPLDLVVWFETVHLRDKHESRDTGIQRERDMNHSLTEAAQGDYYDTWFLVRIYPLVQKNLQHTFLLAPEGAFSPTLPCHNPHLEFEAVGSLHTDVNLVH